MYVWYPVWVLRINIYQVFISERIFFFTFIYSKQFKYLPCFKHVHVTLFVDIIEDYVFGEKYKIVPPGNTKITWEQARKNCQIMGPGWDLLKIQSKAENLIIREMLKCELRGNLKQLMIISIIRDFVFVPVFLVSSLKMITGVAKLEWLFDIYNYDWFLQICLNDYFQNY